MTERHSILQKKLQELEFELKPVFSLPAETPLPDGFLEDIQQRFAFVKNLLSAEITSHPSKPQHLHHIAERLTELERHFVVWDSVKTSAMNHDDNASTCSCTESCLNVDDRETSVDLGSPVYEDDPERLSQGLVEEKALVEFRGNLNQEKLLEAEFFDCLAEEDSKKEEKAGVEFERDVKGEQRRVGMGHLCGALASGLVLGMALMGYAMRRFSGCFQCVEPGSFLTPT